MTGVQRIADVGEDGLVAAVLSRYGPLPAGVLVGPGDDAAVLVVPGPVVACTDTLVEGYDFRRSWSTATDVGIKAAAQNLADIAAMGARPLALLVSLAAPGDLPTEWAAELADGLAQECGRAGAAVIGGDVSQADQIVITGTALGVLVGPAVLRSAARAGDVVALAGRTGASGAGLALLSAGLDTTADAILADLVTAHLAPRPPYSAGPQAALAGATALIDTSDGLLRDAGRVAAASGVVLDLDPETLTPTAQLRHAAAALGRPEAAFEWVLSGGEDHALLACFPADASPPACYRVIGRVRAADGADEDAADEEVTGAGRGPRRVLVGGLPWDGATGWVHFG